MDLSAVKVYWDIPLPILQRFILVALKCGIVVKWFRQSPHCSEWLKTCLGRADEIIKMPKQLSTSAFDTLKDPFFVSQQTFHDGIVVVHP